MGSAGRGSGAPDPGSLPPPSQAHPTCPRQLLQAATVSRCKGDPTCRKVPGEKSQGFPSGRASGEEARLEGLDYRSVTPGRVRNNAAAGGGGASAAQCQELRSETRELGRWAKNTPCTIHPSLGWQALDQQALPSGVISWGGGSLCKGWTQKCASACTAASLEVPVNCQVPIT